jgi:SBP domain
MEIACSYHRRSRCCPDHAAMPSCYVQLAEGVTEQCRFCQQCGKFQALSEFDGSRKSCRRQLLEHNARRKQARLGSEKTQGQANPSPGPSNLYLGPYKDISMYLPPSPMNPMINNPGVSPQTSPFILASVGAPTTNSGKKSQRSQENPPVPLATSEILKSNWTELFPNSQEFVRPTRIPTPATIQPLKPAVPAAVSIRPSSNQISILVKNAPAPPSTVTGAGDNMSLQIILGRAISMEDDPVITLPNQGELLPGELNDDETPPLPAGIDWSPPKQMHVYNPSQEEDFPYYLLQKNILMPVDASMAELPGQQQAVQPSRGGAEAAGRGDGQQQQ